MAKNVAIIGAGLAGLSAGIHLQTMGIKTDIYEMAPWPGGVCTAWRREGFRFDGCVHWMVGTRKGESFYQEYLAVDAITEETPIFHHKDIVVELNGTIYEIPLELTDFRAFLHAISEEDKNMIDAFCDDVGLMCETKMPASAPSNFSGFMSVMRDSSGFLKLSRKYISLTVDEFVKKFQDETIQRILFSFMPPNFSAISLIMMLGTRMGENAGYPAGGAEGIINRMVSKYESLGGTLHLAQRVDEIIMQQKHVKSLRIGENVVDTDYIVAACDMNDILNRMLGGAYRHPQLNDMLEHADLFDPMMLICYGLNTRLNIPEAHICEVTQGIRTSPENEAFSFYLRSFDFDHDASPEGKSSVMVMMEAPLSYWENLRQYDKATYDLMKQRLAYNVAAEIEQRYPGFCDAIEVSEVSTPATYKRIANLYEASYEGFAPTSSALKTKIKKHIPGINNLTLCGQWTDAGGGICSAIVGGRKAAERVLKGMKAYV